MRIIKKELFFKIKGGFKMSDESATELSEINTPETLGVTPRYILQHNAISRSIQNLSVNAKKLIAMAMALLESYQ